MEIYKATKALRALAHETRLEIFRLLVRKGPQGLAVNQITEHLRIPPATLSFHLSHLQRVGLLSAKRQSRQIIYSANYPLMNDLLGFLTENCCQESTEDCCLERNAEC